MNPKVLVMGSIMQDMILRMPRIPKEGESLLCDNYTYSGGGKGANQAAATAKLNAETSLIGCVGKDAAGDRLISNLKSLNIDSEFIMKCGSGTGLAVIMLETTGENRIAVFPEANMELSAEHVLSCIKKSDHNAFLTQLETPFVTVIEGIRQAKKQGMLTVLDAGPAQAFPLEEISGFLDILSPNETETEMLTGIYPDTEKKCSDALSVLMKRCAPRYVIMKLGKNGCAVYDGGKPVYIPAFKVKSVDSTAAGDAFTAAMTLEYLKGADIYQAARCGSAAGALTVMKPGATDSLPTLSEYEEFKKLNI